MKDIILAGIITIRIVLNLPSDLISVGSVKKETVWIVIPALIGFVSILIGIPVLRNSIKGNVGELIVSVNRKNEGYVVPISDLVRVRDDSIGVVPVIGRKIILKGIVLDNEKVSINEESCSFEPEK